MHINRPTPSLILDVIISDELWGLFMDWGKFRRSSPLRKTQEQSDKNAGAVWYFWQPQSTFKLFEFWVDKWQWLRLLTDWGGIRWLWHQQTRNCRGEEQSTNLQRQHLEVFFCVFCGARLTEVKFVDWGGWWLRNNSDSSNKEQFQFFFLWLMQSILD